MNDSFIRKRLVLVILIFIEFYLKGIEALKNGSNAVDCVTTVVKCLEVCTM